MKERIIKFLTQEGLSATKFADEIGVQRSSISHILSGRNNPSFEFIQKILSRYRNINADWLIIGSGQMYKKDEQHNQIHAPLPITPPQQPKSVEQLNIFQSRTEKSVSAEQPKNEKIISETSITPSRNVEKILVFYSDKTFDEFSPLNKCGG
jgi:transcriptional regulator with XRE-family HTH domain